jgi:hypothetical protein
MDIVMRIPKEIKKVNEIDQVSNSNNVDRKNKFLWEPLLIRVISRLQVQKTGSNK